MNLALAVAVYYSLDDLRFFWQIEPHVAWTVSIVLDTPQSLPRRHQRSYFACVMDDSGESATREGRSRFVARES